MVNYSDTLGLFYAYSRAISHHLRSSLGLFQNELTVLQGETGRELPSVMRRVREIESILKDADPAQILATPRVAVVKKIEKLLADFSADGLAKTQVRFIDEGHVLIFESPLPRGMEIREINTTSFTEFFCGILERDSYLAPLIDIALLQMCAKTTLSVNKSLIVTILIPEATDA